VYSQNDPRAPIDFQHYACFFSGYLDSRPALGGRDWPLAIGIDAWKACRDLGYITGDLNKDGDYDDPGEDELVPEKLDSIAILLGLPLRVVDPESLGLPMGLDNKGVKRILPLAEPLDPMKYWVLEAWFWKITHFVVGDGTGRRPVKYDSILGGSQTVANGQCVSLRVFEVLV
jgi:hypothetical protein